MSTINGYENFGKFLLNQMGIEAEPDDWDKLIRIYNKSISKDIKPGLMWINWVVCTYFGMDPALVRQKGSRKRLEIIPRHTAQYLAATLFGYTQLEIGEFYEIVNRSLISNNNDNVKNMILTDKYYKLDIERITNKLLYYDEIENQRGDSNRGSENIPETEIPSRDDMSIYGNGEIESGD